MKKYKLGHLVDLQSGVPITRLGQAGTLTKSTGDYQIFSVDSDVQYLSTDKQLDVVTPDQVLVALIPQKIVAVPATEKPLIIGTNYVAVRPHQQLDARFLRWWFNESSEARRQIEVSAQGSMLTRLSMSALRSLMIELPTLSKQKTIGLLYEMQLQVTALTTQRRDLFIKSSNATLEASFREERE